MKRNAVRLLIAVALVVAPALGALVALAQAAPSCRQQCRQDYRRCVPFCAKNPCFVSCETVREICLSNCGVPE